MTLPDLIKQAKELNWKYWEEPDYPDHPHDWGGVNSDPDHCTGCCEGKGKYFLEKLRLLSSELEKALEENEKLKQIINGTHCSCPYHQKINETDVGKELKRLTEEKEKYRKALEDIKQGFVIGRDSDGDPIQEQVYPSERAQQALHQENK